MDALASLKEAVKGNDSEDIKAKTNALAQASMKLGEAMYAQAQKDQAGPGAPVRMPVTVSAYLTQVAVSAARCARPALVSR